MIDISKYVGVPFVDLGRDIATGVDCWGLITAFYASEYQIELNPMPGNYKSCRDWRGMAETVHEESLRWLQIDAPFFGDVIVFNVRGKPSHVGLYIGDGNFLHAMKGSDSCIEKLKSLKWNKQIHGYYRFNA